MADLSPRPGAPASSSSPRRLVAGGFIRRTAANVRTAQRHRVAGLHRRCRDDYAANASRRAQDHRIDAWLTIAAAEAARPAGGPR